MPADYDFDRRMHGATHLLKESTYTARLADEKMQAMISSMTGASDTSMLPSVELKKSVANVMKEVINVPVHKHFFM